MKKLWWGALVGALLLSGCSATADKSATSSESKASQTETVTKTHKGTTVKATPASSASASDQDSSSDSSSTSDSSATASSSSTKQTTTAKSASAKTSTKTQGATWNTAKKQALASFMADWEAQMGQTYAGTYNGQNPNHLGFIFPDVITSGELNGRVKINNQSANLHWSTTGQGAGNQVVAVATGGKANTMFPTTYFFTLVSGQPVVYMTQTTNGGVLYLQPTANTALQNGFAKIIQSNR